MKSTKKQIIIVFAILTMALVLSCAFVACDKVEPDKEDVCEHVEVTDNAVEPTCTEKGLTEGKHCSKCGKILQAQTEIPALGHDFSNEWTIDKEATCTEKGSKSHHCTRCEVKSDVTEIPTIEHSESDWIIDKETTCTEDGSKHTECTVCHTTIKTEKISALGHTGGTATCTEQTICERCGNKYGESLGHDYKSIVTDPTCTKQGYTTHTCTRCKHSYMDTYIDALGHKETIDEAVEPTCTTAGLTAGKHCSVCGEVLQAQNEIPALGHDLEHHDGKEAICTEKGWKEYDTCKREGCDHTTYEEIPALGHKYGDIIPKTEPTCTENGVEAHYKCSVCNKVFKNDEHKTETTLDELTIAISPNAHNFGNWIKNEGADTHTRVCSYNSKHTKTENCQGGTATCTEQAVCEKCNAKYGELANHEYENGVCIVCGIRRQSEGLEYSLNSDGNGYTVTGIGTCTDKELIIPSEYNAKPVTSIGNVAFSGCTGLTSVTIPNSVTSIGSSAFSDCTGLTSVTIPGSVTSIGNNAFYNCYSLIEVYNKSTLSITAGSSSNGYVAYYAKNVYTNEGESKLTTDENGYVIYTDGDEKILVAYHGTNTELALPSYITKINQYAFSDCISLTSITIPDSVTSIGNSVFSGCTGLTSITVAKGNTKYHSAGNCLIETGSKTLIAGCKNSIIPTDGSVTSIGNYAFEGCTGLTSITIPDSVTSIGSWAFYGCNKIQTIYITDIGAWCNIAGLGNLMNHGASNKQLYINNKLATSITIPNGVKAIPSYAFYNCTGLTSVTIPNSVTSIGYEAFRGCTGLTSVTIPGSVTSIGDFAFSGCTGLTSITFKGTIKQWNAIYKNYNWKDTVPATQVGCTDGTVSI